MKTLVIPAHEAGPATNGHDGCHARILEKGMCPGVKIAKWLNSLGEDDEQFGTLKGKTNGEIRANWMLSNGHVVPEIPGRQYLLKEKRDLQNRLRNINKRLRESEISRNANL